MRNNLNPMSHYFHGYQLVTMFHTHISFIYISNIIIQFYALNSLFLLVLEACNSAQVHSIKWVWLRRKGAQEEGVLLHYQHSLFKTSCLASGSWVMHNYK